MFLFQSTDHILLPGHGRCPGHCSLAEPPVQGCAPIGRSSGASGCRGCCKLHQYPDDEEPVSEFVFSDLIKTTMIEFYTFSGNSPTVLNCSTRTMRRWECPRQRLPMESLLWCWAVLAWPLRECCLLQFWRQFLKRREFWNDSRGPMLRSRHCSADCAWPLPRHCAVPCTVNGRLSGWISWRLMSRRELRRRILNWRWCTTTRDCKEEEEEIRWWWWAFIAFVWDSLLRGWHFV